MVFYAKMPGVLRNPWKSLATPFFDRLGYEFQHFSSGRLFFYIFLFKMVIFRFHVSFEGSFICKEVSLNDDDLFLFGVRG